MTRRLLLRLYPKDWRQRYGEEFARLLEETPLSVGVIANIASAALRVWLMNSKHAPLVWAGAVTWCANVVATTLDAAFSAPKWPIALPWPCLVLFVMFRYSKTFGSDGTGVGDAAFIRWVAVFLVTGIGAVWSNIVEQTSYLQTPFPPWFTIFCLTFAVFTDLRPRQDLETNT